MRIAYFDCFAGVSGDMMLGALIDLGVDIEKLDAILRGLPLTGFDLHAEKVLRNGFSATDITVKTGPDRRHRTLQDILDMIGSAPLPQRVRDDVERVFTRLARAEGKIHNISPERVTFHEVGAADSIIDIVGTVWGLHELKIEQCYTSALALGSGTVVCSHGAIPIPAPATLELCNGFPVIKKEIGVELTTPTGAALVTTFAVYKALLPQMTVHGAGYGCGDREIEGLPNLFRVIAGEWDDSFEEDRMIVIETNIDDMSAEYFPYITELLFERGAADVYLTPLVMKKGRPGHMLSVIADAGNVDECIKILFRETSTLGMRMYEAYRRKLSRKTEMFETPWGAVGVKSYMLGGRKYIVPEYEECRRIARGTGLPLDEVYSKIKEIGNRRDTMS